MLKMVDGTGIIGVDMVCPLGGTVSPPQPPNYDNIEMEGVGSLMLPNSLKAPLERVELIGNSVQGENPSPDNPQEIKSAGRKSKNLLDINYFKDKSNLQTIQCEGFSLLGIICNVKPNTEYTLSANLTEAKYNFNIANKTKRFSLTSAPSRTLVSNDDGTLYIGFYSTTADLINMDDFMQQYKNIQLEEGAVATDYEPYGYFFDMKVTGKNLLNLQRQPDVKGTYQGWKVGDGEKTIVLNIKDKGNNADITKCSIGVSGNGINPSAGLGWLIQDGMILKSEIKTINPYVSIYPPNETAVRKLLERFDIQCEYGDKATPYEPYTEQTLTLTSDRPITKWDKLVEQDGEYGWLYNVEKIILTGEERWALYNKQFYTTAYDIQRFDRAFCECYDYSDALNSLSKDCTFTIGAGVYPNSIFLKDDKNLRFLESGVVNITESLKVFSQYLKDMLGNGTPIEILLKSKKSQFVPLSESEQTQLRNLHSYNGTTNITVDSGEVPCGIKLTYRKEK
nr:MAG TPA: hypothetical protein [Caudoviricetes sp.]